MNPVFSIIIPAYNEERFIRQCLESIVSQSCRPELYEVIVIDNGSTDATVEIAGQFAVTVLIDTEKTVSGLRNLGASHAQGDVLAFVDADCIVSRNWLEQAMAHVDHDGVAMWGSAPLPPAKANWIYDTWAVVRLKHRTAGDIDWLESMNMFVRREAFLSIGGFDESLETCEDVDISYRVKTHGRIVSDPRISVVHLGEAASLRVFFKKELWRGKSNVKGAKAHAFRLRELPSLAIPAYFGLFLPLVYTLALITGDRSFLCAAALLYCLPFASVFVKLRSAPMTLLTALRLCILLTVYFLARTLAVLRN